MFIMDFIESELVRDVDGSKITNWHFLRCPQLKHSNFGPNSIDYEIGAKLEDLLMRTPTFEDLIYGNDWWNKLDENSQSIFDV